jgi:type I restriction enzyme S subunit
MHSKEINIPIDFKVCNGDVLIAMSGATTGKIGVYQNMDLAYINQRVGKFVILNSKKNSIEFVSHFLNSDKFKSGLIKEIAQGAQPNISGKQIESIEIDIPSDLKIQKEIASTLTIMDEEIRKLELKLQKGKSIKQGMMQNLLTGKIRLI